MARPMTLPTVCLDTYITILHILHLQLQRCLQWRRHPCVSHRRACVRRMASLPFVSDIYMAAHCKNITLLIPAHAAAYLCKQYSRRHTRCVADPLPPSEGPAA